MSSFTEIPVLDLAIARSDEKPAFLKDLRAALLDVGFLYIKNTGVDEKLVADVIRLGKAFFDLPMEEKLRLEMKNSPHFLGYSRLGNEITKHATDWREQIDLATELPAPSPSEPRYRMLRGPNQWPSEELLPGFRKTYEEYIKQMTAVSTEFTSLIAEAIGLPPNAFERFFEGIGHSESGTQRQDKLKIVKYPDLSELGASAQTSQGVGPHKDSMLSSYLLQVPPHNNLQIQNSAGTWIAVPPKDGTFVVAMGQGLEAITNGVVASTTHRVVSPAPGEGPRYSIPFFQGVSYDATFSSMAIPDDVRKLKETAVRARGDVQFTFEASRFERLGEATLMNRVQSHPDVAEEFYPDLLEKVRAQQRAQDGIARLSVHVDGVLELEGKDAGEDVDDEGKRPAGRRRAPTIVVERTEGPPSYGEDPGPEGSLERKVAWELRKADALPDEVRVVKG